MKLNWGTSIVIAFVLFIGFIMFMVVQMLSKKELEYDLVVESYYQKELTFQGDLDSAQKAADLTNQVDITLEADRLLVQFPSEFDFSKIKGELYMYRPSDKTLDFTVPLQMDSNDFVLPTAVLKPGRWEVNLRFTHDDEDYFIQHKISI
ncbi:FixH family protein [Psychroflexus montanilacus]|uniref:FixH family protein n=1 Tax=Psychroflexus montanilacus TaxID=2873598 RepID=UPI001CCE57D3|nr:FixH family protein [Psychroflexus montanilacus]MBZ9651763.1 FixH family protein [Psychroflexus montanilacus]